MSDETSPTVGDALGKDFDIGVWKLDSRARIPVRANDFAIGWDVFAFRLSESGKPLTIACHQRSVTPISTGLVVRPPEGYYLQCCSRSGLAKRGIFVVNAPGIIDPDYTGEVIILLYNGSHETHYIQHEHRIAQLILVPIPPRGGIHLLDSPPAVAGRGTRGFGSSGL